MSREHYDWREVEPRANGNWDAILNYFGIEVRKINQNGPCPLCGGNDRQHFFVREKRILSYCRGQCGNSGPGNEVSTPEHMLMQRNGWSFPQMVAAVARFLQVTPRERLEEYRKVSERKIEQPVAMPASHRENQAKARESVQKCTLQPNHSYLTAANTASFNECLVIKGMLAVEMYSPKDELVNVAAIGKDKIHYAAGGPSFGATARLEPMQEHNGQVVLALEYSDAWRIWWQLKGAARVICAVDPDNFVWMLGRMKSTFTHVAAYEEDAEELREKGFEVIELAPVYKMS